MKTLVCWHDHAAQRYGQYLRSGFRHVFIVVLDNRGYWVGVDGMDGCPEAGVVAGCDYDLIDYYRRERGFMVMQIDADRAPRGPFMMAGTCVGLVKAWLGVRAFWVITPYQLYRYLKRRV